MAATHFRAVAARANYLAQDRPVIQFCVKEICREAAHPSHLGLLKLKRLGRYLVHKPRLIMRYHYQTPTVLLHMPTVTWQVASGPGDPHRPESLWWVAITLNPGPVRNS